jgi:hypothetical protein
VETLPLIRRIALGLLFVPVLLAAISLLGLLFGGTGTVVALALKDHTDIKTVTFRVIVVASITLVACVGTVRILNLLLGVAQRVGQRAPRLLQVASDSLLLLVGFGGLVGVAFLTLGVLNPFPGQRVPSVICGTILSAASSFILVPRIRRARGAPTSPPTERPPSGAFSAGRPPDPSVATGPKPPLRCSFCNKSQRDVPELIAGPRVQICSECVQICVETLAEARTLKQSPASPGPPADAAPAESIWCALCRMLVPLDKAVAVPDRGWVCQVCADAVREAIDFSAKVPTP